MTWHKHFKSVNSVLPVSDRSSGLASSSASISKYSNWLPEVYSGPPDRLQRYAVYDQMQLDHEISSALDTIADFGTEVDEITQVPLVLKFNDEPTPTEVQILEKTLKQWCRLNELHRRLWTMFRSVLIYGDQFFIRDPETFKLYWVDPAKVEKVIVNESEGKRIETYYIKDVDLNIQNLVATNQLNRHASAAFGSNSIIFSPPLQGNVNYVSGGYGSAGTASYKDNGSTPVDAEHVVQLSLTDGMNSAWPFGQSILEQIYKVYKQKGLIEDAILIYRIHRAPERRVFFIDVGTTPPNKAQQFLERVRYEVQQKRIPSRTGGACFAMGTQVPLLDGRVLTIREISEEYESGKENWAYSCDPATGKMVPGLITWAGVTQQSARVTKLTLDNGEVITCTPDHKFPVVGKGFVRAEDILVNEDSLFSFNTRLQDINENGRKKGSAYQQVYDHECKEWIFTHRAVAGFMKTLGSHNEHVFSESGGEGRKKNVIHHMNFNRYDNNPSNLFYMNGHDHFRLHSELYGAYFNGLSEDKKREIKAKQAEAVSRRTPADWCRIFEKAMTTISQRTPERAAEVREIRSAGAKRHWANLRKSQPDLYQQRISDRTVHLRKNAQPFKNQKNEFTHLMICKLKALLMRDGAMTLIQICQLLTSDDEFMDSYRSSNAPAAGMISKLVLDRFTVTTMRAMLRDSGFNTWREFLKSIGMLTKQPVRKLSWHPMMMKILVDAIKRDGIEHMTDALAIVTSNAEFMHYYSEANTGLKGNASSNKFTMNTFRVFITDNGYKSWTDLKTKVALFNHKVVSIELVAEPIEVGTLTIDGDEIYHNYHTFAIQQGVYTKNSNVTDATYNPMSILEDYFFAVGADGRGSKVEVLPSGSGLSEIDDLRYFNNKMLRALGVPSSYLPTGPEDGTAAVSDGRVGSAFIQEFRFSKVVKRHQNQIIQSLDREFKLFLKHRGLTIDNSLFEIQFTTPQSFSEYRQLELDSAKINTFTALTDIPYVSKRFILKRYLGWTEGELAENERMWKEERSRLSKSSTSQPGGTGGGMAPSSSLSDVGITSSGIEGMAGDGETDMGDTGMPGAEPAPAPPQET